MMCDDAGAEREVAPLLLTVDETAELLRVSRNTAYGLVRRGEIPSLRLGRGLRIPARALERLIRHSESNDAEARGCRDEDA